MSAPLDHTRHTVLITGASAGIGTRLAHALARRGSNLVLAARRADRLDTLATTLRADHGITITTLPTDLTRPGAGTALRDELDTRDITVTGVVNNAGFANHGPFHELALADLHAEIALDVSAVVDISHAFLPRLRERGEGYLINVASMAAYVATPTTAVYGACKAFVLNFTEALWYESRGTGVRVFALSPGATETEFFDVAGQGADGGARRMTPDDVVATALATLERREVPPSVAVGASNALTASASRLLSRRRATTVVGNMMTRPAARA